MTADGSGRLRVRTGLSVRGSGSSGSGVTLQREAGALDVLTIRSVSDSEVVADLPAATVPGSYTVTATTPGGSDRAIVVLMLDPPGSTAGCQ